MLERAVRNIEFARQFSKRRDREAEQREPSDECQERNMIGGDLSGSHAKQRARRCNYKKARDNSR